MRLAAFGALNTSTKARNEGKVFFFLFGKGGGAIGEKMEKMPRPVLAVFCI